MPRKCGKSWSIFVDQFFTKFYTPSFLSPHVYIIWATDVGDVRDKAKIMGRNTLIFFLLKHWSERVNKIKIIVTIKIILNENHYLKRYTSERSALRGGGRRPTRDGRPRRHCMRPGERPSGPWLAAEPQGGAGYPQDLCTGIRSKFHHRCPKNLRLAAPK